MATNTEITAADDIDVEIQRLEPRAIFGFEGKVEFGLLLHPDGKHIIFPLGTKIGISNRETNRQEFISGHSNNISCLDVSQSGRYLASGQINHMGFRGYVILWDWAERKEWARHDLHKVRVQSICFTANDKYVVSIGGQDDGAVIVFDIETHTPICRAVASNNISGNPLRLRPLHNNSSIFIASGDRHLRMWSILHEQKKLHVTDVSCGKLQRRYTGMRVDRNDNYLYLGTMSGDVVKVRLNCCDPVNVTKQGEVAVLLGAYGKHNPRKPSGKDCDKYVNGVRCVYIVDDGIILIGAGDGTIELVQEQDGCFKDYPSPTWPKLKTLKKTTVNGAVTSFANLTAIEFLIGTDNNEIYWLNIKTFDLKLIKTCHKNTVKSIVFPKNLSSVVATAGYECIRIWSIKRLQELLRIMVYNFSCTSIVFTNDGTSLLSAWNDGVIRAFTPITGKLIFAIPNAHNKGCSALAISSNGRILVSGGIEGQVRVWKIEPFRQSLIGVLKDHSAPVSSLHFNHLDTEVVSASRDGSCVIWDVNRLIRKQVITANTQFRSARYFPTGVQILTGGSDGRIGYWMVFDGSLIRDLEGAIKKSVNSVSINSDGNYFVSASSNQIVKLWDYERGIPLCIGDAHATPVVSCAYSPCGKFFVSGSRDGAVIIWDIPKEYWPKSDVQLAEAPKVTRKDSKINLVEAKVVTGSRNNHASVRNRENINGLAAARSNKDVLCMECPPINAKQKADINETTNCIPSVRNC